MATLGRMNTLRVIKYYDFGMYLEGEDLGEILLPTRYIPEGADLDDMLEVFIYLDSEDRLVATTEKPYVMVGQFAHLRVKDVGQAGAYLDWGLMKDLFVPFKEQRVPMDVGKSYTVCVFIDNTGRIAASSKLDSFFDEEDDGDFEQGQEVDLHIASRSDLGYKAIIDGSHLGLIHQSDIFRDLRVGQDVTGYIKLIREDGRIDLTLQPKTGKVVKTLGEQIISHLEMCGGSSTLTDKSSPEEISREFGVSKANFKRAIGLLYKEKRITLGDGVINLVK
ncbi:MAG: GntR family transcriptional regulator [Alphaproteobacteria bacterium]|nr:GntR family transcriptional regulator [Alphaproteobacteria bacterium]